MGDPNKIKKNKQEAENIDFTRPLDPQTKGVRKREPVPLDVRIGDGGTVDAAKPTTFLCSECERSFKTNIGLGQHLRRTHPAAYAERQTVRSTNSQKLWTQWSTFKH